MSKGLKITGIEVHVFRYELTQLAKDEKGLNLVYTPGGTVTRTGRVLRILTGEGLVGEHVGFLQAAEYATLPMVAPYLIGADPLERERIYTDVKRVLRQYSRLGIGPIDIALWDLAGKYYGASVAELLGGYKKRLPCYASTYHGDEKGGLDTPEAYADFAERCLELGYRAFKIHGWGNGAPIEQEVETVHAVGRRVGGKMDLMLDPACEYTTFADAVKVGRACDDEGFFWYEDPFRDGGLSQFAHRKLRQLIRTPLLIGEHLRSLEPRVDFALAEATDFVRGDVEWDGITGTMKLAHAAEGLGLDIELHGANPATRHCMAAIRNTNYYELGLVHPKVPSHFPPIYLGGYSDTLEAVDDQGCVPVPQGPGLGVELDWEFIRKNRIGLETYP